MNWCNYDFVELIMYPGYTNEVGEAFRALVSANVVRLSYGIAAIYCLADTADKTRKAAIHVRMASNFSAYNLLLYIWGH